MKVTLIPIVIAALGKSLKGLVNGLEDLKISGQVETIADNNISQNTEKSPRDLRRLAVTQTPVRNHQPTLVGKTLKSKMITIMIIMRAKKQWHMKVMMKPIITSVLGTIPKGLVKGLEDLEIREQVETIQTTALLRSTRILRRIQES